MTKPYDIWLSGFKNTPAEVFKFVSEATNETTEFVHAIVDLHFNLSSATEHIAALEGRIHELEAVIDGRENDFGLVVEDEGNHTLSRPEWAWPEKED